MSSTIDALQTGVTRPLGQAQLQLCFVTDATLPLPLGIVLDGRYRVTDVLGHGGMGHVYAAEDLSLGRSVAIKVVRNSDSGDNAAERLFREAKAAARAEHPAIVIAYGYGSDPDYAVDYFVMERLHGETLDRRIERVGPLAIELVLRLAIDICDALIAVHDAGVIHRDLKPSNICLVSRGRRVDEIKLLDFGVAKQLGLSPLTISGELFGTPQYMAPEQFTDSKRVDGRCDLYALGVVMFEVLTGLPPFAARGTMRLMLAVSYGAAPDVRSVRPETPVALAAIIARCLEKEREQRFADARELYQALGAINV